MKKSLLLGMVVILAGCGASASRSHNETVVSRTYYHKYGMEMGEQDWNRRGRDGQIASVKLDGSKVVETYSNGDLHGNMTTTFPHSDTIDRIATYNQGKLEKELFHTRSGSPEKEVAYHPSGRQTVTLWYEGGMPQSIEEYEGESLLSGQYMTANNAVESSVQNGNGVRTVRDRWGMLLHKEQLEDGDLVLRTTFHPNSSPKEEIPYANHLVEGVKKIYFPSGEPEATEEWSEGKRNGLTTLYQNGEKVAEIPFVNDQRDGVELRFRGGNTVVQEISWTKGQRHGPTRSFIGNVTQTEWYMRGREVTCSVYDEMRG